MRKKLITILLALIASVCLALGLSACGDDSDKPNGDSHTHTYSADWSYDQTYHWHSCTKENCDAISEKTEHTFVGDICTVCGYQTYMNVAGKTFELASVDVRWAPFDVPEDKITEFEAQKQALKTAIDADSDEELFTMLKEGIRAMFEEEGKCKIIFSEELPIVSFVGMGDPGDLGGTYYQDGNYIYFSNSMAFGGVFAETLYLEGNTITMRLIGTHSPSSLIEIVLTFENNADDSLFITPENPSADSVAEKTYEFSDYEIEYEIPEGLSQDDKNSLIESINWIEESIKESAMYISFDNSMNFTLYSSGEYEIYSDHGLYYQDNSLLYIPYHEGSYDNMCVSICQISGTELSFNLALSRGQFSVPASIRLIFEQISTEHVLFYFEANEATCKYEGNMEYWYCPSCGKYFSDADGKNEVDYDDVMLPKLEHKLQTVAGKAATCTEVGWEEYEQCTVCGTTINYNELSPLGHDKIHHDGKAATCTEAGWEEYDTCSRCDYTTYKEIPAIAHKNMEHYAAYSATCTADGNTEYWYCPDCGKYFSDANGNTEIAKDSWVIAATEHKNMQHTAAVQATCTKTGNMEYWYCHDCGKYFTDAKGNNETTIAQLAISATGHTPADPVRENEVPATCTAEGSYDEVVYCEVCNTEISRTPQAIDKLAHTPADPVCENEVSATCTAEGSYDKVVYCEVCHEELSRATFVIPAKGHTYSEEWSYDAIYHWHAATCDHINEVDDMAEHTLVGDKCSVCGAIIGSIGLEYMLSDDGIYYIVSSVGTAFDSEIVIPSEYKGLPVKTIADSAFSGCDFITTVYIPDSVTSIGNNAFYNCYSLTEIAIPDSVIYIGDNAFNGCNSLMSIMIPEGVKNVGAGAFKNCTKLLNIIVSGDNVVYASVGGILYNKELTEIIMVPVLFILFSVGGRLFPPLKCGGKK